MKLEEAIEQKIKPDKDKYAGFIEVLQKIAPGTNEIGRVFQNSFVIYGKIKLHEYLPPCDASMLSSEIVELPEGHEILAWIDKDNPVRFRF